MKIYRYHSESGMYLGEDYSDEPAPGSNRPVVPADATSLPPPQASPGQVAVFNGQQQRWEIHSVHDVA